MKYVKVICGKCKKKQSLKDDCEYCDNGYVKKDMYNLDMSDLSHVGIGDLIEAAFLLHSTGNYDHRKIENYVNYEIRLFNFKYNLKGKLAHKEFSFVGHMFGLC